MFNYECLLRNLKPRLNFVAIYIDFIDPTVKRRNFVKKLQLLIT